MNQLFDFVARLFGPKDFRNLKWKMFMAFAAIVSVFYAVKIAFPTIHIQIGDKTVHVIPQSQTESYIPLMLLLAFGLILALLDVLYDRDLPPRQQ